MVTSLEKDCELKRQALWEDSGHAFSTFPSLDFNVVVSESRSCDKAETG
jgi:hypothetical protein